MRIKTPTTTIIERVTLVKYRPRSRIIATAELYHIEGNRRPHFAISGEIIKDGRRDEAEGISREDIVKIWPVLRPVLDLHLSDDNGEPMHGEANGWYWLAGACGGLGERYHGGSGEFGKSPEECERIFAEHIRDAKTARNIIALFRGGTHEADTIRLDRRAQWDAAFGPRVREPSEWSEEAQHIAAPTRPDRNMRKQWAALYDAMKPRFQLEANRALAIIRGLSSDFG